MVYAAMNRSVFQFDKSIDHNVADGEEIYWFHGKIIACEFRGKWEMSRGTIETRHNIS
jgi:hypothetical protein